MDDKTHFQKAIQALQTITMATFWTINVMTLQLSQLLPVVNEVQNCCLLAAESAQAREVGSSVCELRMDIAKRTRL